MMNHHQLDFVFWSKLDAWSYRDAALLLCGFDPDRLKGAGIRLDGRELPEEFAEDIQGLPHLEERDQR